MEMDIDMEIDGNEDGVRDGSKVKNLNAQNPISYILRVSHHLQNQHITTCVNDRKIESMCSQTLNAYVVQLQWD